MKNGKRMKLIAIFMALSMIIGVWPYGNCAKVMAANNLSGFHGGTGTAELSFLDGSKHWSKNQ